MKPTAAPPEELIVQVRYIASTQQFAFHPIQRSYRVNGDGNIVAHDQAIPAQQGMVILADFLKSALVASVAQQAAKPTLVLAN